MTNPIKFLLDFLKDNDRLNTEKIRVKLDKAEKKLRKELLVIPTHHYPVFIYSKEVPISVTRETKDIYSECCSYVSRIIQLEQFVNAVAAFDAAEIIVGIRVAEILLELEKQRATDTVERARTTALSHERVAFIASKYIKGETA